MTVKNISLRWYLSLILILFVAVIMIFLWIFQVFFLNGFYRIYKTAEAYIEVNRCADIIFDDNVINRYIRETAAEHQLGITVHTGRGQTIYYADGMIGGSLYRMNRPKIWDTIIEAKQDSNKTVYYLFDYENENESAVTTPYAQLSPKYDEQRKVLNIVKFVENEKTGEQRVVSVHTLITPLYATVNAIKSQLLLTIPILLVLSFFIALYMAKSISKPISSISSQAKKLATEPYHPHDPHNERSVYYKEAEELDQTLSEVSGEILAAETLRKEFLANISHDLRTPLTMIRGYGEMMRDIPGENTAENLQVIIDEAERMNNLVDGLLLLSKLQSGKETQEFSPCCLTEMLEDTEKRYHRLVPDGQVDFQYSEKVYIMADKEKLLRAIYNLVDNALKYGGDSKKVEIRQRIIESNRVKVLIRDEGPGISKEDQKYIWNRYFRAAQNGTRSDGSGLGLPITKEIVRLHQGECGVESQVGEGSTFWFTIPTI